MNPAPWSPGKPPLLGWYGDDFTGAAAVMEILAFSGLPTVLFTRLPDAARRARVGELAAIGLAGTARAESPEWMAAQLPEVYAWLDRERAELVHYKVCSTLDSSPGIGSIGRAAELGLAHFGGHTIPCVVADPVLGRHQCFGHLFARAPDGRVYRLDRHPVMANHPVTPMREAEVARHLGDQTHLATMAVEATALVVDATARAAETSEARALDADRRDAARLDTARIACLDLAAETGLPAIGTALWAGRARRRFVIGSQGVERALVRHWFPDVSTPERGHVRRLGTAPTLAISGSLSATTEAQIARAATDGFETCALPVGDLLAGGRQADAAVHAALAFVGAVLERGHSPLLHTRDTSVSDGPRGFAEIAARFDLEPTMARARLGTALGRLLRALLTETGLRRTVVAGGDTSGRVLDELDLWGLRALAPVSPGLSIHEGLSDGPLDGIEIALKGGQMGEPDCFDAVRLGGRQEPAP